MSRKGIGFLLLCGLLWGPTAVAGQRIIEGRWPMQPSSRVDRVIAPFMEGWYANEDGSFTYSFGYLNMNDQTIVIPVGEHNRVEPAGLSGNGLQPTVFLPGRRYGVFAVTVPASAGDTDVWWSITTPNGKEARVPGRHNWSAYELDWRPKAHGSVPPRIDFEGGRQPVGPGLGPAGVIAERVVRTQVGRPTALAVSVKEVSVRSADETDPSLRHATPVHVVWTVHQAPIGSEVTFARHESTSDDMIAEEGERCRRSAAPCAVLNPDQILDLESGEGDVRVVATFSAPGEYLIHVRADNWGLPDSSAGNQCCHTNGFQRVRVDP